MAKKKTKSKSKILSNPMWERFCRFYVQSNTLFGNATHSYAEANNVKLDELSREDTVYENISDGEGHINRVVTKESSYDRAINTCAVHGNRLVRNSKVNQRIVELLNELMTDEFVDSELVKVIKQDNDLGPKVSAIKEYNALKTRIKTKVELSGPDGKPLFSDETKAKAKKAVAGYLTGKYPR